VTGNREAIERFLAAIRSGAYGDDLYADDVVVHDWTQGDRVTVGREAVVAEIIQPSRDAFPDGRMDVLDVVVGGDVVVVRARWIATFLQDYGPIEATGTEVDWEILDQYRFRDGQIREIWFGGDTLSAARALGALPNDGVPW
jgi:ketosteroid isomerase-like protein